MQERKRYTLEEKRQHVAAWRSSRLKVAAHLGISKMSLWQKYSQNIAIAADK